MAANSISIPVAPGELIDKITILQIKSERISGLEKRQNVRIELHALQEARRHGLPEHEEVNNIAIVLKRQAYGSRAS